MASCPSQRAIIAFILLSASACSGKGGYQAPPLAMPTVAFSAPNQGLTINLGQAVTLAWASTGATSCSATTSASGGGSFSGTQSGSGMQSVVPTATGSYTYTLDCMGMGGNAVVSTPTVKVNMSILGMLAASGSLTMIGPTPDAVEHGGNPYGLAIAPVTAGLITAGDLVVCNFNDGATNTQGKGTTIVGLHPVAGAMPYRIALGGDLEGCNALTMLPDDSISAAAYMANKNPLVSAGGVIGSPFSSDTFGSPWGEAFVAAKGGAPAALYVSNISGAIDRITLNGDVQTAFTEIAKGFCGSGAPGALFGPAGLTYDASIDTLYIVDTSSASVVAFAGVSNIGADGVVVNGQCSAAPPTPALTFSGASASAARVIAHGAPLVTPLSAALLADGDLVVGNADINIPADQTPNLMIEVSPSLPGGFVGMPYQADTTGVAGALFGIATALDADGNQIIYFNDDNANAVMKLSL